MDSFKNIEDTIQIRIVLFNSFVLRSFEDFIVKLELVAGEAINGYYFYSL